MFIWAKTKYKLNNKQNIFSVQTNTYELCMEAMLQNNTNLAA